MWFKLEVSTVEPVSKFLCLGWGQKPQNAPWMIWGSSVVFTEYVKSEEKIPGRCKLFTHKQDTSSAHKDRLLRGKSRRVTAPGLGHVSHTRNCKNSMVNLEWNLRESNRCRDAQPKSQKYLLPHEKSPKGLGQKSILILREREKTPNLCNYFQHGTQNWRFCFPSLGLSPVISKILFIYF